MDGEFHGAPFTRPKSGPREDSKARHTPQVHGRGARAISLAKMPRWLRPKLTPEQVRDLSLAHHTNLDAIATGTADETILWQYVGGVLTWSRVADLLKVGQPEMAAQLELAHQLIETYRRTGRVLFTGPQLELARDGVVVQDLLAQRVDQYTASLAADWSESQINKLAAEAARKAA